MSAAVLPGEKRVHYPKTQTTIDDAAFSAECEEVKREAVHFKLDTTLPISLRPLKERAEYLAPDHPLRVLLAGEPDELPVGDYLTKLPGWYRLLRSRE